MIARPERRLPPRRIKGQQIHQAAALVILPGKDQPIGANFMRVVVADGELDLPGVGPDNFALA